MATWAKPIGQPARQTGRTDSWTDGQADGQLASLLANLIIACQFDTSHWTWQQVEKSVQNTRNVYEKLLTNILGRAGIICHVSIAKAYI